VEPAPVHQLHRLGDPLGFAGLGRVRQERRLGSCAVSYRVDAVPGCVKPAVVVSGASVGWWGLVQVEIELRRTAVIRGGRAVESEKSVEQFMQARQRQEDIDDGGDTQPLLVGGLEQDAGTLQRQDRVLDFASVTGAVVGVRWAEARVVTASRSSSRSRRTASAPSARSDRNRCRRKISRMVSSRGVRDVVQQGREPALAFGDGLALETRSARPGRCAGRGTGR